MTISLGQLHDYRKSVRDYLLALAEASPQSDYWKQQISGTFIGYADGAIQEAQGYFIANGQSDADAVVSTASSLIKLLSNKPITAADNADTLERMLQRPGSVIPNNPQRQDNKINIADRDATTLFATLIKISFICFLHEHKEHILNARRPETFTVTWLDTEIAKIARIANEPHNYCTNLNDFDAFDELERVFGAMNLAVNKTIEQTRAVDTHTRAEIRKKDKKEKQKHGQKARERFARYAEKENAKRIAKLARKARNRRLALELEFINQRPVALPERAPVAKKGSSKKVIGWLCATAGSYLSIAAGLFPGLMAFGFLTQLAISAIMPIMLFFSIKLMYSGMKWLKNSFAQQDNQIANRQLGRANENYEATEFKIVDNERIYAPQLKITRKHQVDKRHDERQARTRKNSRFTLH